MGRGGRGGAGGTEGSAERQRFNDNTNTYARLIIWFHRLLRRLQKIIRYLFIVAAVYLTLVCLSPSNLY